MYKGRDPQVNEALLTCTINSSLNPPCAAATQKDKFARRHTYSVFHFIAEAEESVLPVHAKRVTMDLSLLSVPNTPAVHLQPNVSHQVLIPPS